MKALLIVSHGSRRQQSNEEVNQLAEKLVTETQGTFTMVESAFLEITEPSISEGISKCIDAGASSVLILPYFLAAGRHVAEDIPAIVAEARQQYPDIDIKVTTHAGASPSMPAFLADIALNHQ